LSKTLNLWTQSQKQNMEEIIDIKKYISAGGTTLEIGDLYGSGDEEVITTLQEQSKILKIFTNQSYYDLPLQAGDWLKLSDDTSKLIKSKYDKFDE